MWRSCERFSIRPDIFEKLPVQLRTYLLAYNNVREHEEAQLVKGLAHAASLGRIPGI